MLKMKHRYLESLKQDEIDQIKVKTRDLRLRQRNNGKNELNKVMNRYSYLRVHGG